MDLDLAFLNQLFAHAIFKQRIPLARLGVLDPDITRGPAEPELQLYRLLRQAGGDAYSTYNALLRELVSFEQALDRRSRAASNQ